jgi:hypothetical protein
MASRTTKSFIAILEEQIRDQLRAEIRSEIRSEIRAEIEAETRKKSDHLATTGPAATSAAASAADRLATWLTANIDQVHFSSRKQARTGYASHQPHHSEKTQAAPRPAESAKSAKSISDPMAKVTSVEDLVRVELLRRNGAKLGDSFTRSELKAAWRKVALKTHPDRFTGADHATQLRTAAIFREVASAVADLEESLFSKNTSDDKSENKKAA